MFKKDFEVFKTISYPLSHLIQIMFSSVSQENPPHFTDEKKEKSNRSPLRLYSNVSQLEVVVLAPHPPGWQCMETFRDIFVVVSELVYY